MEFSLFKNPHRVFSVVLFIEQHDLDKSIREIQKLGGQRNLKLIVQPCPFEGIEFLYRVSKDLVGHFVSLEKDVFWEAIELKKDSPENILDEVSAYHLAYLTAILEQDPERVKQAIIALKGFEGNLVKPLAAG